MGHKTRRTRKGRTHGGTASSVVKPIVKGVNHTMALAGKIYAGFSQGQPKVVPGTTKEVNASRIWIRKIPIKVKPYNP